MFTEMLQGLQCKMVSLERKREALTEVLTAIALALMKTCLPSMMAEIVNWH